MLPAWEVDLLLDGLVAEFTGGPSDIDASDVDDDQPPTAGRRFTMTTEEVN